MKVNGLELDMTEEICNNMKEAVSKYGVTVVCDEEEEEQKADVVMPAGETCEEFKKIASKYGTTVLCDEQ